MEMFYKARLVAKGYSQKKGFDYNETFAPVIKFTSLRILLALAAHNDWAVDHLDFRTAFLNRDLDEEIYLEQPEGFTLTRKQKKVLKLRKSLYGLKQAPRQWNIKIDKYLKSIDFTRLNTDYGIYVRRSGNSVLMIALYVDDLIVTGNNQDHINEFKKEIQKNFKIDDLGPVSHKLGIKIIRDRAKRTLQMNQELYINDILRRSNMADCKPSLTPCESNIDIKKEGKPLSEKVPYMEAIGSLIYLMVATRPDISYIVGVLSRYMSKPTEQHWMLVKRVLSYLKGTKNNHQI